MVRQSAASDKQSISDSARAARPWGARSAGGRGWRSAAAASDRESTAAVAVGVPGPGLHAHPTAGLADPGGS